jgi:[ribosomal protein S5]-alanine N-acetyltransferase
VVLAEMAGSDAPELLDLIVRNREFLRPWDPIRPASWFTLASVHAELARANADRRADRGYVFGIRERDGGALVGRIALSNVVRGAWQNATVGYFVGREHNGLGYATAAMGAALRFAFGPAGLHRVQAAIMPRNVASIRVVEKNGFRFEGLARRYLQIAGTWEDHNVYAVTVEEWPGPG